MSTPATAFEMSEKNEVTQTSSVKNENASNTSLGSKDVGREEEQAQPELQRRLKARHLQMIAIGMFLVFDASCVC